PPSNPVHLKHSKALQLCPPSWIAPHSSCGQTARRSVGRPPATSPAHCSRRSPYVCYESIDIGRQGPPCRRRNRQSCLSRKRCIGCASSSSRHPSSASMSERL